MSLYNAVVLIDHHHAKIVQFDADHAEGHTVKDHPRNTRQHGSDVRTEHEFFGHVCDALAGIARVLIAGPHTSQSDFRHYVEKHRPHLVPQIAGWETVDHPSEGQLVALARRFFVEHERMANSKLPS